MTYTAKYIVVFDKAPIAYYEGESATLEEAKKERQRMLQDELSRAHALGLDASYTEADFPIYEKVEE